MSRQPSLAATLIDIGEGAVALASVPGIRPKSLEVTLPVEFRFFAGGELRAELPKFVTRTAFDRPPARLALAFEAVAPLSPDDPEGLP